MSSLDISRSAAGCARAAAFGALLGGVVGASSGALDVMSSLPKPRPDARTVTRAALQAAGRGGGTAGLFFATYHAAKCALGEGKLLTGWQRVGAAAAIAALPAAIVRPNWTICVMLVLLDNGKLIFPQ